VTIFINSVEASFSEHPSSISPIQTKQITTTANMQFKTSLFALPFCLLGAQAALPVDQIVGGLNNFRDLATSLQSTASSISPIYRASNTQLLQTCADGWSQALQGGTQFVSYIVGTPYCNDATQATAIYKAFDDCATAHKLLLKTLSDSSSGAGLNSVPGAQLASTMLGIHKVIEVCISKTLSLNLCVNELVSDRNSFLELDWKSYHHHGVWLHGRSTISFSIRISRQSRQNPSLLRWKTRRMRCRRIAW
jgi:hypothetical protein